MDRKWLYNYWFYFFELIKIDSRINKKEEKIKKRKGIPEIKSRGIRFAIETYVNNNRSKLPEKILEKIKKLIEKEVKEEDESYINVDQESDQSANQTPDSSSVQNGLEANTQNRV